MRILVALSLLVSAVPAWAGQAAEVPEGSHLTLLALGVLGIIVGRRASMGSVDKD